ncbi:glucan biosynthesis protein G [Maritimibacter sp. 55A14]|uniref:glucan biosynthesis protein n=1 Tax=Maritimibacter sp. 55A14 TaxID=2174844 RepID=UPI000D61C844|nr:glucan biosynthesis protein G [Maritimibacter sp. 55A14]PWE34370.1 glucan biosynthesis protein G [Maritimibacter sp. 55A14]
MLRRAFVSGLAALAAVPAVPGAARAGAGAPFDPDALRRMAQERASRPFTLRPTVPQAWLDLKYEQYSTIRYKPEQQVWRDTDTPLRMEFFPNGLYYPFAVGIHVVENGRTRRVAYDPAVFARGDTVPDLPQGDALGYSGFRLLTELETADIFQEFFVMQGASYFRAHAPGQVYGISGRGLALKTAEPEGEEFPEFTDFWVLRPEPGAEVFRVYALLDSPSTTGLYRFDIRPGPLIGMEVSAELFPRKAMTHVGLGALTSMFFFDETNRDQHPDFRPAVHDSDGLLIFNGAGERLWRPLANPKTLQVSAFLDENPKGFGLMQRERQFDDFADLVARYELRPSLWVTPGEDWGRGAVTLVEIPTDREIYDNIVAYWRPAELIEPGASYAFSYRLDWGAMPEGARAVAPVINTRMGPRHEGGIVVAIDFGPHAVLPDDPAELGRMVRATRGRVGDPSLNRNPETGGLRLDFTFFPEGATLSEMRAQLTLDGRGVSEVWLYRWTA